MNYLGHPKLRSGTPLPDDEHAVSTWMGTIAFVRNYEKGDPEAFAAIRQAYPRFLLHPYVDGLNQQFASTLTNSDRAVFAFPSLAVAQQCVAFAGDGHAQMAQNGLAFAVLPEALRGKGKEFWQHTGQIVSSRQAKNTLTNREAAPREILVRLKERVGGLYNTQPDEVYLSPTGMSAIFQIYQAVVAKRGTKTIQFGFPYADTWKIQQKFGEGSIFVPYNSAADFDILENLLRENKISAVFCEVPNNPLLRTPDMPRLKVLLTKYGVPLIIDDTLGPPLNLNLQPYADVQVVSLTKSFVGTCNVMGGAVVLNTQSPHYQSIKDHFKATFEELLHPDDAQVLLGGARDYAERLAFMNDNAARLANFLRKHPLVDQVYYTDQDPNYEALRRLNGGYGGLLSFTTHTPEGAFGFYDRLLAAEGPSLGANCTLVCPYALLAHYHELPWAQSHGVAPHLMRVSLGLENYTSIERAFAKAFNFG